MQRRHDRHHHWRRRRARRVLQLQGANVSGGVRVTGGAFVLVCASTINGGFAADGAGQLIFGAEEAVATATSSTGQSASTTRDRLIAPAPSIAVERSTLNGGLSLIGNQGQMAIAGNRISATSSAAEPLQGGDEGMKNIVSGQVSCTFK
jgi:hypothetical protein